MKTLVIHPADPTTEFLKEVYFEKDWTVVSDGFSDSYLKKQIAAHDRIIMLGHGDGYGLFALNGTYVVSPKLAYLLRNKLCFCIWCHADRFVKREGLKGFCTGMFISELGEAQDYDVPATQEHIDFSNMLFAQTLNHVFDKEDMYGKLCELYSSSIVPVIQYNNERLFYKTT